MKAQLCAHAFNWSCSYCCSIWVEFCSVSFFLAHIHITHIIIIRILYNSSTCVNLTWPYMTVAWSTKCVLMLGCRNGDGESRHEKALCFLSGRATVGGLVCDLDNSTAHCIPNLITATLCILSYAAAAPKTQHSPNTAAKVCTALITMDCGCATVKKKGKWILKEYKIDAETRVEKTRKLGRE